MVEDDTISRNAASLNPPDPRINPAVPDSIGALLAEEWTVNSRSTLPSFLERMLMEEARRSGWETLRSIFMFLEERMSRIVIDAERHIVDEADFVGGVEERRRLYRSMLRRWRIQIVRTFHEKLVRPFGPEIRFLVFYIAERLSLMHSNASITEALYGGTRVKLAETSTPNNHKRKLRPIEKHDSVRLAFFLAFGLYLEERSKFLFQFFIDRCLSFFAGRDPPGISKRKEKIIKTMLRTMWPLLRMTSKGTILWYRWRYFLGVSVFFDPYSSLLNLVVRRTTMEDQQKQERITQAKKGESTDVVDSNTMKTSAMRRKMLQLIKSNMMRWASGGLASFFVALAWVARIRTLRQELQQERELHELRQTERHEQQRNRSSQEETDIDAEENYLVFTGCNHDELTPSPPLPPPSHRRNTKISTNFFTDRNSDVCPLCKEPRIHPTASTSGYVFCLKCILAFLRQNGAFCPITRKPCPESSLVRLYEPT